MRGYEAIASLLGSAGTRVVFSMLGATSAPWIAHGVATDVFRLVKTRHETAAVVAAMGYAQATGEVGVCSVTRGPGFTNACNAMISATRMHAPVVVVVGDSPTTNPKNVQQVDQRALTEVLGAGFHHVDGVQDLPEVVADAFADALQRRRPQVVSLRESVLGADGALDELPVREPRFQQVPDALRVASAADALMSARRPVILAGQGAVTGGVTDHLAQLATTTGAALATTLLTTGLFSGHGHNLGIFGGFSPYASRRYFQQADVVLAVGASLNGHTTDGGSLLEDTLVIHCDIDEAAFGAHVDVDLAVHGDVAHTVPAILAEVQELAAATGPGPRPAVTMEQVRTSIREVDLGTGAGTGLDPRDVYRALDRVLPEDRIVVTDSGRWLRTLPTLLETVGPRSFLPTNSFGSIGLGLGAGIGAAVGRPDRPVVVFAGDGGFLMTSQELDAVRLAGIDLTVVVMNDGVYGSEVQHLEHHDLPLDVITQDTPDLVALARVYGGDGIVVRTRTDLDTLTFAGDGLRLIDVRIDPGIDGQLAVGAASEVLAKV